MAPPTTPQDSIAPVEESQPYYYRTLSDSANSLLKGSIGIGEGGIGLVDTAMALNPANLGRRAARSAARYAGFDVPEEPEPSLSGGLEQGIGYRPREARRFLDEFDSPELKAAKADVAKADGFIPTVVASVKNPSTVIQSAIESAPSMLAGAGVARGLLGLASGLSPVVAGAIGEGAVSAGQSASQTRRDTGTLTPTQAATAVSSGAVTGVISRLAGRVADALKIPGADPDVLMAGGRAAEEALVKRVAGGFIREGMIEELPQSAQEQVQANIASGRPWDEGVAQAAATGLLIGGVMGAGGNLRGGAATERRPSDLAEDEFTQTAAPSTPEPPSPGPEPVHSLGDEPFGAPIAPARRPGPAFDPTSAQIVLEAEILGGDGLKALMDTGMSKARAESELKRVRAVLGPKAPAAKGVDRAEDKKAERRRAEVEAAGRPSPADEIASFDADPLANAPRRREATPEEVAAYLEDAQRGIMTAEEEAAQTARLRAERDRRGNEVVDETYAPLLEANREARTAAERAFDDQTMRPAMEEARAARGAREEIASRGGPAFRLPPLMAAAVAADSIKPLVDAGVPGSPSQLRKMLEKAKASAQEGEAFRSGEEIPANVPNSRADLGSIGADQNFGHFGAPVPAGERTPVAEEARGIAERVNPVGRAEETFPAGDAGPQVERPARVVAEDSGESGEVHGESVRPTPRETQALYDEIAARVEEIKRADPNLPNRVIAQQVNQEFGTDNRLGRGREALGRRIVDAVLKGQENPKTTDRGNYPGGPVSAMLNSRKDTGPENDPERALYEAMDRQDRQQQHIAEAVAAKEKKDAAHLAEQEALRQRLEESVRNTRREGVEGQPAVAPADDSALPEVSSTDRVAKRSSGSVGEEGEGIGRNPRETTGRASDFVADEAPKAVEAHAESVPQGSTVIEPTERVATAIKEDFRRDAKQWTPVKHTDGAPTGWFQTSTPSAMNGNGQTYYYNPETNRAFKFENGDQRTAAHAHAFAIDNSTKKRKPTREVPYTAPSARRRRPAPEPEPAPTLEGLDADQIATAKVDAQNLAKDLEQAEGGNAIQTAMSPFHFEDLRRDAPHVKYSELPRSTKALARSGGRAPARLRQNERGQVVARTGIRRGELNKAGKNAILPLDVQLAHLIEQGWLPEDSTVGDLVEKLISPEKTFHPNESAATNANRIAEDIARETGISPPAQVSAIKQDKNNPKEVQILKALVKLDPNDAQVQLEAAKERGDVGDAQEPSTIAEDEEPAPWDEASHASPRFRGDAAEYTGKTEKQAGTTVHEAKITEGNRKGDFVWFTQRQVDQFDREAKASKETSKPSPRRSVSTEKTKAGMQVLLPGAEGMMDTTGRVGKLKKNQEDVNRGPLFTQDEEAEKKADAKKQGPLFSRKPSADEPRDLILQHNLTAANLIHADKMGGLAVPSMAVGKVDMPLEGFGEITLLGDKNLADPRESGMQVFSGDIYSPRYPTIRYKIRNASVIDEALKESNKAIGYSDWQDEAKRGGIDALSSGNPNVVWTFLRSKGIEPDVRLAGPSPERMAELRKVPGLEAFFGRSAYQIQDDPEFRRLALKELEARHSGLDEEERRILRYEKLTEDQKRNVTRHLAYELEDAGTNKVDRGRSRDSLRDQLQALGLEREFETFRRDLFERAGSESKIFKGFTNAGNERIIPHTLENVVAEMKRNMKAGEGFSYGPGTVRGAVAPRLKSLQEIRNAKDRIVSKEVMAAVKEEVNSAFWEAAGHLPTGEGFGAGDRAVNFMVDVSRMGFSRAEREYGWKLSEADRKAVGDFMTMLQTVPTEYFEAKLPRAVGIDEFKVAVVPNDTDTKAIAVLEKHGLKIERYDRNNPDDRRRAIKTASQEEGMAFSRRELQIAVSEDDWENYNGRSDSDRGETTREAYKNGIQVNGAAPGIRVVDFEGDVEKSVLGEMARSSAALAARIAPAVRMIQAHVPMLKFGGFAPAGNLHGVQVSGMVFVNQLATHQIAVTAAEEQGITYHEAFARAMTDVLIHEAAHYAERGHGDAFLAELERIREALGPVALRAIRRDLMKYASDNKNRTQNARMYEKALPGWREGERRGREAAAAVQRGDVRGRPDVPERLYPRPRSDTGDAEGAGVEGDGSQGSLFAPDGNAAEGLGTPAFIRGTDGGVAFSRKPPAPPETPTPTPEELKDPTFWEKVTEWRKGAMLSSIRNLAQNAVGNVVSLAGGMAEIPFAAAADRTLNPEQRQVYMGELAASLAAFKQHGPEALGRFKQGMKDAMSGVDRLDKDEAQKFERHRNAIGGGKNSGAIEKKIGTAIRTSFRIMGVTDEFFKDMAYQQALYREAYRQARNSGLQGAAAASRVDKTMDDYRQAMGPDREAAKAAHGKGVGSGNQRAMHSRADYAAKYRTFTLPADYENAGAFGWVAKNAADFEKTVPVLGPALGLAVPFKITPAHVAFQAYERTPFAAFSVVSKFSELRDLAQKLKQSPDEETTAALTAQLNKKTEEAVNTLARAAMGSVLGAAGFALAAAGLLTGSGPPDPDDRRVWQDAGHIPNAIRIGDSWYAFDRLDPVLNVLALAANLTQASKEKDANKLMGAFMNALQETFVNNTFLDGFQRFSDMLKDPTRYGKTWLQNTEGSFVPSMVRQTAEAIDPTVRNRKGIIAPIVSGIPGLSKSLPPVRTGTGEPAKRTQRLGESVLGPLSPFGFMRTGDANGDPLAKEFLAADYAPDPHRDFISVGVGPVGLKTQHRVDLTEKELEIFRRADEAATKQLREAINSAGWGRLNADQKKAYFQRVYSAMSAQAKKAVMPSVIARLRSKLIGKK